MKEVRTRAGGAPPHNQRIEPTARRRHRLCSGRSILRGLTANPLPVPSGPSASQAGLRRCSRLIRALYGRSNHKNECSVNVCASTHILSTFNQ
jgi:hypothetical protein